MYGETGENPVRARRREVRAVNRMSRICNRRSGCLLLCSTAFAQKLWKHNHIRDLQIYPDATIRGMPLGKPEKADV